MVDTRKSFLENAPRPGRPCAALYVHVPVCRRRCRYCDFCSIVADDDLSIRIADALIAELDKRGQQLQRPLATAFVGGGTPTALPTKHLGRLLSAIGAYCDEQTEFSVEANPVSLTPPILETLVGAGVNRLSVGVQSFIDAELATLGRLHDGPQAIAAVSAAANAGIPSLSVDLIYGTPGQTLDTWRTSLDAAIDRPIDHVSCYCLSYGEGTPLAADTAAGRRDPMDEDIQRDCYELAIDTLEAAGLRQYEISNFARGSKSCRHNITYWKNEPYVGIGPSAVSYTQGFRAANTNEIDVYLQQIADGGSAEASSERLIGTYLMAETAMLALRTREGISRRQFRARFSTDPLDVLGQTLRRYRDLGIVCIDHGSITLARQGLFVSDAVFADMLAEAENRDR